MNPRRCIISYARKGREDYPKALKRMITSGIIQGHGMSYDNAFLIISPDCDQEKVHGVTINRFFPSLAGVPDHTEVPYAFKPHLFKIAFDLGFEQVMWCDSTIVIHKPLAPIWDLAAERGGVFFQNSGCPISHWTSDDALDKMGCPGDCLEDEIMACSLTLDIRHPKGKVMFEEWMDLSRDGVTYQGNGGSSRPEFKGHRHDQSAMSWLRFKHQVPMLPYGTLCYHNDIPKFPECVFANTGVEQA